MNFADGFLFISSIAAALIFGNFLGKYFGNKLAKALNNYFMNRNHYE